MTEIKKKKKSKINPPQKNLHIKWKSLDFGLNSSRAQTATKEPRNKMYCAQHVVPQIQSTPLTDCSTPDVLPDLCHSCEQQDAGVSVAIISRIQDFHQITALTVPHCIMLIFRVHTSWVSLFSLYCPLLQHLYSSSVSQKVHFALIGQLSQAWAGTTHRSANIWNHRHARGR